MELDEALGEIRDADGHGQVRADRHGCLPDGPPGGLQRAGAPRPLRGGIAGDGARPGLGLHQLPGRSGANPDMDGAELGQLIVESYIQEDQRIVDDQARAEMLTRGSPMGGLGCLAAVP